MVVKVFVVFGVLCVLGMVFNILDCIKAYGTCIIPLLRGSHIFGIFALIGIGVFMIQHYFDGIYWIKVAYFIAMGYLICAVLTMLMFVVFELDDIRKAHNKEHFKIM
jgi:hypothetical protein